MIKLFVYGIFLRQSTRDRYHMVGHEYATVAGYITVGEHIVQATKVDNPNIALTGLVTSIHEDHLPAVDRLEGGYDRIKITTNQGEEAYMYVEPERYRTGRRSNSADTSNESDATGVDAPTVAETTPAH